MLATNPAPMKVAEPSENEIVSIRKLAQQMASARRESLTTAHLLAAIASRPSAAAELLQSRRLDTDTLARLARASTDDERDPIGLAMRRAAEVARSSTAREPNAIHLLVALLSQRTSGAFRALEQSGIDVSRLRSAAIQIATGLVEPPRAPTHQPESVPRANVSQPIAERPRTKRPAPGVIVPLFPRSMMNAPARVTAPPTLAEPAAPAAPAEPQPPQAVPPARPAPPVRRRAPKPGQQLQMQQLGRFELSPKAFPVLSALGINLSVAAVRGELDPVVGREQEIEQVLDVLAKRRANNPCLVGRAGVGKTSVARGLAQRIVSARDVRTLDDRVLVELPLTHLLAGTAVRGSLAERIEGICKEVREAAGRVVLFVDDVHQLFGDGSGEATAELKLALSKGELPMLAATSFEEYRRTIDADPALARCFTPIDVEEPAKDVAIEMITGISPVLENHHGLRIEAEAVMQSVDWTMRYMPCRALPEKALSVLDLAGARCRRRGRRAVDAQAVAEVVAEMVDMPVERLLETDRERMLALEKLLAARVVGHSEALGRIATILRRNAAGLRAARPIGSFLLLGPTGIGKTETAKAIAEALFHSSDAMTRLDMSEFAEPHSLARLIGSPPGYVGHEAGGQLTEAVRNRPYQVLLLDEFEKAHRDVLQAFLQVLDEGRMTDGRGRTVDFTNTVVVMTSNLGGAEAAQAAQTRAIGFSRQQEQPGRAAQQAALNAARAALPPELYNRIDEVLSFAPLTRADVQEIARRLLHGLSSKMQQARGVIVEFDDAAIDALLDGGGFDPALGARPMKRAIARLVEAPLAELVLREEATSGDTVKLSRGAQGQIELHVQRKRGRS